jgi:hypothetical protein
LGCIGLTDVSSGLALAVVAQMDLPAIRVLQIVGAARRGC